MRFDATGRLHVCVYEKTNHEIRLEVKIPGGLEESEVERYRDQLQNASFLAFSIPTLLSPVWTTRMRISRNSPNGFVSH